jgi:hypothetical protein
VGRGYQAPALRAFPIGEPLLRQCWTNSLDLVVVGLELEQPYAVSDWITPTVGGEASLIDREDAAFGQSAEGSVDTPSRLEPACWPRLWRGVDCVACVAVGVGAMGRVALERAWSDVKMR